MLTTVFKLCFVQSTTFLLQHWIKYVINPTYQFEKLYFLTFFFKGSHLLVIYNLSLIKLISWTLETSKTYCISRSDAISLEGGSGSLFAHISDTSTFVRLKKEQAKWGTCRTIKDHIFQLQTFCIAGTDMTHIWDLALKPNVSITGQTGPRNRIFPPHALTVISKCIPINPDGKSRLIKGW